MNKNTTLCIVSPAFEHIYNVCLTSLNKFLPNWDHIKISTESPLYKEIAKDYPYKDISHQICAVRPRLVKIYLEGFQYNNVLFLGSDVVFYNEPWELRQFVSNLGPDVFVTPHVVLPSETPVNALLPNLASISKTGHINSDFVCWKNTPKTKEFLEWQAQIHKTECVIKDGVFLDQTWLNYLPYFQGLDLEVCKLLGYNMAYWRNPQDMLKFNEELQEYWIENDISEPLICFQYSGFLEGQPERISRHCNYPQATGDYLKLLTEYDTNLRSKV